MFGFRKISRSYLFNEIIHKLETNIEKYKITTLASIEHKGIITDALSWLLHQQDAGGYWGNENHTFTALALIVLKRWEQVEINSFTKAQITQKVQTAINWLKTCFTNGWGIYPQIWIRSLALYSIDIWQYFDDDCSEELTKLMKETTDSISTDNAHHYSRLLILLDSQHLDGYINQINPSYIDFILSMKELNTYSHYFLSEIIIGYKAMRLSNSEECDKKINDIIVYLENSIGKSIIDSWSFVPYCASIIALGQEERETAKEILKDNYFKMFRSGGQRADGSFYSDIAKTCWALLALHQIREVQRISLPSFVFHKEFRIFREAYKENLKIMKYKVFESYILILLIILTLIVWYNLNIKYPNQSNIIAWICIPILTFWLGRIAMIIKKYII
jgi:hypothetical protein